MFRTRMRRKQPTQPMGKSDARAFAEQSVDWFLGYSPAYELGMLAARRLQSPSEAKQGFAFMRLDVAWVDSPEARRLATAIVSRDRAELIDLYLPYVRRWSLEEAEAIRAAFEALPLNIRQEFEKVAKAIKRKVGPKPKANAADFPKMAALGSGLAPIIEKLLGELAAGTKSTIREHLVFWTKDHPTECEFLISHLARLEEILKNRDFLKRATRPKARARLIADAMAGTNYKPRTAVERVREGRRRLRKLDMQTISH